MRSAARAICSPFGGSPFVGRSGACAVSSACECPSPPWFAALGEVTATVVAPNTSAVAAKDTRLGTAVPRSTRPASTTGADSSATASRSTLPTSSAAPGWAPNGDAGRERDAEPPGGGEAQPLEPRLAGVGGIIAKWTAAAPRASAPRAVRSPVEVVVTSP